MIERILYILGYIVALYLIIAFIDFDIDWLGLSDVTKWDMNDRYGVLLMVLIGIVANYLREV